VTNDALGISEQLYWIGIAVLLVVAIACFLYAWHGMTQDSRRYHSYEPLPPKEDRDVHARR
jgi:hypothetical protein